MRRPLEMGEAEVRAFLEHLPTERNVAAATQDQALNAIEFLYTKVPEHRLGDIGAVTRAKRPRIRDHLHPSLVHRPVSVAMRQAGLLRAGSRLELRHSRATNRLANGTAVRTVQALMGHRRVEKTQIYTHVLGSAFAGVRSPLG